MPAGTTDYGERRGHMPLMADLPPLIITCAVTGGYQKQDNPHVPVTAEEQAAEAAALEAAGAAIIHLHGRTAADPTKDSSDPADYQRINACVRQRATQIIIDNTQTVEPLPQSPGALAGRLSYYKSAPMLAKPEIMALNPGPMTFRGSGGVPSSIYVTSFDDTARAAAELRERGIKPQVFLYHPGHLDLLEYLIARDVLQKPYFVQLVFGQQSGITSSVESVAFMVRLLPENCLFQTCALGLAAVQVNVQAILLGGHVRTGLEDNLLYQRGEPARGNVQLVERIVRIAHDLGRRVATPEEARAMLGLGTPSTYP